MYIYIKLTEEDVFAIEKALNHGSGTFEAVVKKENGKIVVLQVLKKKVN